jgi:large subunit ribosomal protein L18
MNKSAVKQQKRTRRHSRIRAKVIGDAERPRLAVFRSNRFVYAQIIDDEKGTTIASSDSRVVDGKGLKERAHAVGKDIAAKAAKAGVEQVVFDRGGFLFAGSVKELAEGAREGGLKF